MTRTEFNSNKFSSLTNISTYIVIYLITFISPRSVFSNIAQWLVGPNILMSCLGFALRYNVNKFTCKALSKREMFGDQTRSNIVWSQFLIVFDPQTFPVWTGLKTCKFYTDSGIAKVYAGKRIKHFGSNGNFFNHLNK